jgi:hypothetical protein
MFDMFSKNDEAPKPPVSEMTDNTPIMTESTPVGGGAETPQEMTTDMSQVPDTNSTPDMSPASDVATTPAMPDVSPFSSMDTAVPTQDTPVAEPVENINSDTVSMPAEEPTASSIGEMPVNTVIPETNTPSESSEKAKDLVDQRLRTIESQLSNFDGLKKDLEDLKRIVDANENNRPILLEEMATLKKINEGLENRDADTLAMAKTFLRLGESASDQPTNTESQPIEDLGSSDSQTSDTQAA